MLTVVMDLKNHGVPNVDRNRLGATADSDHKEATRYRDKNS